MFEFHGWIVLLFGDVHFDESMQPSGELYYDEHGEPHGPGYEALVARLARVPREMQAYVHLQMRSFHPTLTICGFRNHHQEEILDIFRWVGRHVPASYGFLFTRDPEDTKHYDMFKQFRIFRLFKGELEELETYLEFPEEV